MWPNRQMRERVFVQLYRKGIARFGVHFLLILTLPEIHPRFL